MEPGHHQRPVRGLALDAAWARDRMELGSQVALRHQLLLQVPDGLAVLAVHGDHRAQLRGLLHHLVELAVVHHDGALVGHEHLERGDAVLLHHGPHLLGGAVAPAGDRHVVAVVGDRLLRLLAPRLEGVEQRFAARRDAEVDDGGGAAGDAGGSAALEVVGGDGAHEAELHVHVGVDEPGQNELARGAQHLVLGRALLQALADRRDPAVGAVDIRDGAIRRGHDLSVLDQQAHRRLPSCRGQWRRNSTSLIHGRDAFNPS